MIKKYHKGLSFIEVLYSIILMVGVMVLISQFFSQSTQHLDRSKRYYLVTQLLEQKMTELEILYEQEGVSALQEIDREDFKEYQNYSWSLETVKMPHIPFSLNEEDLQKESDITKVLENISKKVSDLVTEVKLTVHYTQSKQEASYSITTYFIDFKKGTSQGFLQSLLPQI